MSIDGRIEEVARLIVLALLTVRLDLDLLASDGLLPLSYGFSRGLQLPFSDGESLGGTLMSTSQTLVSSLQAAKSPLDCRLSLTSNLRYFHGCRFFWFRFG